MLSKTYKRFSSRDCSCCYGVALALQVSRRAVKFSTKGKENSRSPPKFSACKGFLLFRVKKLSLWGGASPYSP